MLSPSKCLLLLFVCIQQASGFVAVAATNNEKQHGNLSVEQSPGRPRPILVPGSRLSMADADDAKAEETAGEGEEEEEEQIAQSTIKIDDGGSDLTDRFKYKVNALMGVFDPQGDDDERQDGNILNAMLTFPIQYSFNIVGKTSDDTAEAFVQQVKDAVMETTGDEDGMQCQITPRGKNYTKVTVQATVQSAAMISGVYKALEGLEMTVMRF
ncbi:expressed unknown protein [Seminavis robusta]|uniref:Uncharacterized protein n=1 Tax=Seminavis robusta TaxID=568900 RepID=A0A9N8ELM5_9STRA|nr:expressed unknown protein [Seminavis robusta]|eukprot:Sro1489_g276960.1 n/a (212) ;mRNA; f:16320-17033